MGKDQTWSIGIYAGPSPLQLAPMPDVRNPVLTAADAIDVAADFVADPFLLRDDKQWHLFFEIGFFASRDQQDRIGWATSPNLVDWTYQQIVLCPENVRLSYPHVFRHEDEVYMIPESHVAGEARLYRAAGFPRAWALDTVLVREPFIVDCSPFEHGGRWWMFANGGPPVNNNMLDLHFAHALRGPWRKHPLSPLNTNPREARPAGRVIQYDGRLFRLGQDCGPAYGTAVRAFEVLELTETQYKERPVNPPLLGPSGTGWNAHGMHHLDAHRLDDGTWIAAVDGFHWA